MVHKVVKPFPYSEDGITLIGLNVGDERDFGELAGGLASEGWVEAVDGSFEPEPIEPEPAPPPEPEPEAEKLAKKTGK
jgi:hypothetical protein